MKSGSLYIKCLGIMFGRTPIWHGSNQRTWEEKPLAQDRELVRTALHCKPSYSRLEAHCCRCPPALLTQLPRPIASRETRQEQKSFFRGTFAVRRMLCFQVRSSRFKLSCFLNSWGCSRWRRTACLASWWHPSWNAISCDEVGEKETSTHRVGLKTEVPEVHIRPKGRHQPERNCLIFLVGLLREDTVWLLKSPTPWFRTHGPHWESD